VTGVAPRILAHRGASGYAAENSLEAFREARRWGADGVELDVHPSADGAFIVHHDPDIPLAGPIARLTLSEIKSRVLPNGETIPTLTEALAACAGLEVWVELKALGAGLDEAFLEALGDAGPALIGVHSFDHRIIARLGNRRPGLRRGVLSVSYPVDPVIQMRDAGAQFLWQEWGSIDAELVHEVHRMGGEVIAWTVPDAGAARRLAELGVDALCGNYPDRLRIR
jgi:glycerophosphoryl diester phosphodiesterase